MPDVRSLVVQSVLFGNAPREIVRAAEAVATSVKWARAEGLIGEWSLLLGDCSDVEVLDASHQADIRSLVLDQGGSFEYHVFGANLGSAAGHNALAPKAVSDLILILNPDAVVAPDAVEALARVVVGSVGIAEARQVPLEHPKDYEVATGNTSWASTACALTPRLAFDRVHGFDSKTFFLYCDDVDYSWQLRLAGYRVVYEPAARVFHDKRLTVTADWPASSAEVYFSAEAAIFLAHKYSRPDLVSKLVRQFRAEGTEVARKVVESFERRRSEGTLPLPVDSSHTVAQFIGGNYAVHRF
ncbi:glycosyltransferase family 2 protein [Cryobacterium sp. TmT2-59]|uniref:Glycosyltransferase family 2 protein n=1 Tax=Cryobacterium shii TaxID=1259235 RepID=A0AAQ2C598_9MICO|nr:MULTISPECIES: glycosyltransferase family 2 protein [Cryobacterium]TFC44955.1 glycosyltransferase family 2 protein [Cryobacterium shii]TFC89634.1 glycosyltransferase family 2 protein [Cryobacterium sp. TmT2-59]TFD11980.1 glycosyltransferase family 2 protein [Cryobacterium sp. TMT4-10]